MEKTIDSKTTHAAALKALTAKLIALDTDMENLAKSREIKKIIEMIKIRNGWTTLAELAFTNLHVEVFAQQVKTIQAGIQKFSAAADMVKDSN